MKIKQTIKRIVGNIVWLFNHPPTNITVGLPEWHCMYCGIASDLVNVYLGHDGNPILIICRPCQRRAFDRILKDEWMGGEE